MLLILCFCSLGKDTWINDLMSEEERILLTMVNYYHTSYACFATIHLPKSWEIFCWLMCLRISWERTATCGVLAELHLLWEPFPNRFTVVRKAVIRKAAPHLLFLTVEEFVHPLLHHILLPFSGMIGKGICMKIILLQNTMCNQSCCNRLLQFCSGPWHEMSWGHSKSTLSTALAANGSTLYSHPWWMLVSTSSSSQSWIWLCHYFSANKAVDWFYKGLTLD